MIAVEIPLIITKIIANLVLFFTVYLVWLTGKTPSYSAVAFFIFNISGLLFVAIGFKENIIEMARSYLLHWRRQNGRSLGLRLVG